MRSSKAVDGITTDFVWAGGLLMHQNTYENGYQDPISWSYDQSGKMVGFTWRGAAFFYLRNLQGDVVGIYNEAGTLIVKYSYDAWGKLLTCEDDSGYNLGEINPIRHRGYYYDIETGYYYCQSRYYCPEWCRWISADVLMDTGVGILGTNMYAYCSNDPVNFVDPSGLLQLPPLGLADAGLDIGKAFSLMNRHLINVANKFGLNSSAFSDSLLFSISEYGEGYALVRVSFNRALTHL